MLGIWEQVFLIFCLAKLLCNRTFPSPSEIAVLACVGAESVLMCHAAVGSVYSGTVDIIGQKVTEQLVTLGHVLTTDSVLNNC